MDSVPLAADFCWACGRYSGESIGIDPDGVLDHTVHYRTCSRCKLSRFCSAECLQSAWCSAASNYKFLCNANQAFSVEFRRKLRCLRDSFPCQSQPRYLSMLQAIHWCWGLKVKMVVCGLHPSVCQRLNGVPGIHNGGHNTHGGFFFLSNPGLTVAMPIPDDPSLPIMAVIKKEMQGLYIYLPGETSGGGRWRRFVRRIIFLVCTKKTNNDNSNRQQEQHQSQQQQHQRQQ
jgi:hypothetical protein